MRFILLVTLGFDLKFYDQKPCMAFISNSRRLHYRIVAFIWSTKNKIKHDKQRWLLLLLPNTDYQQIVDYVRDCQWQLEKIKTIK